METLPMTRYFDAMSKARKSYARFLEPVCQQWELTRCELDILLFLFNNPTFDRAADIVEHRGIAKSHVSLGVNALVTRGLIARTSPREDRRNTHLTLTDAGRAIASTAHTAQGDFFHRIFADISEEELIFWQKLTLRVCENIDEL